ncbi:CesT family type III secretion system chaperone [Acidovorax sp. CCYZU-2555]|uniref:CesT family type III secretion system chaperone n=1 Tax=Acidovorax sp. CCYZU-2555 TaxID=2835042 RepID=UPI001BCCE31A|nr:CesT family type III secretion system chaperone [Acidovorax sp. CCYZU-2555]MBS7779610.1 CesT family type III secretion system chaperone [Acidovorax sp. CCYZU-2555]
MSQAYHTLLRELAEEIGLDPDELLKTEEIVIDELPIGLQLEGKGDECEIWLCALLAAPSADRWAEVARTVLQANHLWTATGGGTLGMLPSDSTVSLNVRRLLRDLDCEKLAVLLAKTADIGLAWQDFITLGIGTDDLPAFSSADMNMRA